MPKSQVDGNGFQLIPKKRSSKARQTKNTNINLHLDGSEPSLNTEKTLTKINDAVEDLQSSVYLEGLLESVSTVVNSRTVCEIVCLGLGHFSGCNISRHQLGLLLSLKEFLKPKKVLLHDPVFYKSECVILKKLGLEVIEQNQEGGYVTSDNDITLLYFPHCPKQLTNNFLWANWGPKLEHCLLICNSFQNLCESQPDRILKEAVPYIYKVKPYTKEIPLENNYKYSDIFNDTSLHTFPIENIDKLESQFWSNTDKPSYKEAEEFITSLMVQKLNL